MIMEMKKATSNNKRDEYDLFSSWLTSLFGISFFFSVWLSYKKLSFSNLLFLKFRSIWFKEKAGFLSFYLKKKWKKWMKQQCRSHTLLLTGSINMTFTMVFKGFFKFDFRNNYRIFSNKRPFSFKRPSPINTQYNPKNILQTPLSIKRPSLINAPRKFRKGGVY